MAKTKKGGYIDRFLKKADKAIDEGIKRADEVLYDAVEFGEMAASQAKKTSEELRKKAIKEKEIIKEKGVKKINEGMTTARMISGKADEDLATLEKLGKLRKMGVLTEKEFQEKKKKILSRI
ncbi:MAG: SHOCT domain-containing protein [Nitrosopumilus sp.]|nr:SHOCT domain-containing protein [Nitrosopumilus sp.]MDH3565484.1 SHOCT domain-containing protein [Nitrosopumilus sp.]MDH5416971.1 SHOCT domain-containing protein [Nitrosopumilus sp.]MDH5555378.1 SHOCT domain-containing protein [Nitrosopumilus sp.]